MAITVSGLSPRASATAAATAHVANNSAAGIDTAGSGPPPPAPSSSSRSARVIALRRSMAATSAGHHSDTSHTSPGASAANTYPPTPSTPLASVVHVSAPAASIVAGNRRCGASATPGFSVSSAVATERSASHPCCAWPPVASGAVSCAPALHPRAAAVAGLDTA
eukprot:1605039-Pleurochrysis_carterae.AAC.1